MYHQASVKCVEMDITELLRALYACYTCSLVHPNESWLRFPEIFLTLIRTAAPSLSAN